MSIITIRKALETALNGISPAIATGWENTIYTPVVNTPYQHVWIIPAEPDNQEYGKNYREQGLIQINLYYPQEVGPAQSDARFELIRSTFKRGSTFLADGQAVVIEKTPWMEPAFNDGTHFCRPVRIQFYAHVIA
jgi:hypothetical protein